MADRTDIAHVYLSGAEGIGLANREDLLDIITIISPTDTPFFSSVAKGKCNGTKHEWLEEELKSQAADSGVVEGADFAGEEIKIPTRLYNFAQIFKNSYQVTNTQEAVRKAGKSSEEAWQAMRAMKEHAINLEVGIFGNTTGGSGGDLDDTTPAARQLRPITDFINATNKISGGGNVLQEDSELNVALETAWENGGSPNTAFVTGKVKRRISAFMQDSNRTLNVDGGQNADKKLTYTVDIYESDFSTIRIVASRWLPIVDADRDTCSVYLLEMGRWRFDFLRQPKTQQIAPTGDATKAHILCEGTLVGLATKSSAEITGVENYVEDN